MRMAENIIYPNTQNEFAVIHLGDAGSDSQDTSFGSRTVYLAERFRGTRVRFYSIDLQGWYVDDSLNITNIKADYYSGLRIFRDESVSLVVSDVSFGFYDNAGKYFYQELFCGEDISVETSYLAEVIGLVWDKLKPNRRFYVSGNPLTIALIEQTMKSMGIENVETRPFRSREYNRTPWTRNTAFSSLEQLTMIKSDSCLHLPDYNNIMDEVNKRR